MTSAIFAESRESRDVTYGIFSSHSALSSVSFPSFLQSSSSSNAFSWNFESPFAHSTARARMLRGRRFHIGNHEANGGFRMDKLGDLVD